MESPDIPLCAVSCSRAYGIRREGEGGREVREIKLK